MAQNQEPEQKESKGGCGWWAVILFPPLAILGITGALGDEAFNAAVLVILFFLVVLIIVMVLLGTTQFLDFINWTPRGYLP